MKKFAKSFLLVLFLSLSTALFFSSCEISTEQNTPEQTVTITYKSIFATAPEPITIKQNSSLTEEQLPTIKYAPYTFFGWFYEKDKVLNGTGTKAQSGDVISTDITLYANWIPTEYKIIFDANNKTGETAMQTVTFGKTQKLNSCPFVYDSYKFSSWNTKADGSGTSYSNEADFTLTNAGDLTLYAQWIEADRFFIFYKNTKGIQHNKPSSYRASVGVKITDDGMSLTGYNFEGFYDSCDQNENGTGTKIEGWNAGEKSSDITLYARYTPITYKIKFVSSQVATGTMEDITATYDQEIILPECNYTKEAYYFKYWYFNGDYREYAYKNVPAGESVKNLTMLNGQIVYVTAILSPSPLIIYYHYNNGTAQQTTENFYITTNKTISKKLYSSDYTGHTFCGWYEDESATGEQITSWSAGKKTGDVHLYAKWQPITYTIKFDANGGEGEVPSDITAAWNQEITIPDTIPIRDKYKFLYWSSGYAGYKDLYPGETYTNIYKYEGNITYKAVWQEWKSVYHDVGFNGNYEGAASVSCSFTEADTVDIYNNVIMVLQTEKIRTRTGYTFEGWYETPDCSGVQITGWNAGERKDSFSLYAKWTANNTKYTVKHYLETSDEKFTSKPTKTETSSGKTDSLTNAKPQDYDGFIPQPFAQAIIAADGSTVISIYYNRKTVTVTLDLNGGTGSETQFTGKYGQSFSLPTDVVKSGYSLAWIDADGNEMSPTSFPACDMTYTAKWTANSAAINVSAPTYSEGSPTILGPRLLGSDRTSITLYVNDSWESYLWTVDGVNLSETGSSITLKKTDYSSGQHFVMLTVKSKTGNYYSASVQITVQK